MAMQQRMGWMNRSSFVVFVVLLCALAAVSSEERNKDEEVFLRQIVDPASGEIDKDLAELLWTNCRQDFTRLKEAVKDIDKWFLVETSGSAQVNSNFQSLAKENIHKIISVLHHPLKRTLSDCLGKSNIVSKTSGEEGGSRIWYAQYLDSLYPRTSALRRHLSIKLLESTAEAPSPAPQQAPSPSPQPAPSPDANHQFPAESPHSTFFPPDVSNLSSPPPPASGSSDSSQSVHESKKTNKSVVIAVAVTASTTFVVAALFFLCCSKACRKGSRLGQNDERPLLSLSLSNFSVGSAEKPFASGNSIKEENTRYQSFGNNSIHHKKGSSLDGDFYNESDTLHSSMHGTSSVGAAYGVAKFPPESFNSSSNVNGQVLPFPLKPPPGRVGTTGSVMLPLKPPPGRADPLPSGRVGTTGSVMLPLKPPPGRADPLPPEPPSSFRPPPRTAAPPLPPAPPSLLKPSSAAAPRPPGPPPPPPPVPPGGKTGTHPPPPPPKSGVPPPRPPPPIAPGAKVPRPPLGSKHSSSATSSVETGPEVEADAPKAKLKPFFWDKVLASPDQSMVWHQIKSGSFQFNEEMIETLFGYNAVDRNKNERRKESSSQDPSPQYIQIFESKRSQNLSILLRAVNVTTEEVCDALNEGNELPSELLQTLLKMAPTAEEELKLRLFSGELAQLGPAERFLKALINIPFAFKRLETLLFMSTLQEEATLIKESFATLEVACKELKNSRLFLKLLEAVLKTGNRMNDGTFRGGAQAFKLDTLLKLSDVKGIDGKTTLLHFVVQEIIRSEGVRAARAAKESRSSLSSIKSDDLLEETSHETEEHYRSLGLQVVSGLGNELGNVKKAAIIDADSLTGSVAKLGHQLIKTRDFLNSDMKSLGDDGGFYQTLKSFVENAGVDVTWLLEEEKRIMRLVKSTGDYFHGKAGKDEGVRLFVIVRDFLVMLDKACKEVKDAPKKPTKTQRKDASSVAASSDTRQPPDLHQRLFPAITDRRIDYSSSDDDNP